MPGFGKRISIFGGLRERRRLTLRMAGMSGLDLLEETRDTTLFLMFSPYNILAGFIFGTIGWGSWRYGRSLDRWKPVAIGVALMVYPYFIYNSWLLWGIGVGLLVLLWFQHHD